MFIHIINEKFKIFTDIFVDSFDSNKIDTKFIFEHCFNINFLPIFVSIIAISYRIKNALNQ